MPNFLNRVRETSTTTGTGDFILAGAYPGAYRRFSTFGSSEFYYTIVSTTGSEWETGIGTFELDGSDHTLHRDTVLDGSSGASLVDFGSGTKDVFCDVPASVMQCILDAAGCGPDGGGGTPITDVDCADISSSGCTDWLLPDGVSQTIMSPNNGTTAWTGTLTDILNPIDDDLGVLNEISVDVAGEWTAAGSSKSLVLTWGTGLGEALRQLPTGRLVSGIQFQVAHWVTTAGPVYVNITSGDGTHETNPVYPAAGPSANISVSTLRCINTTGSTFDVDWFTTLGGGYTGPVGFSPGEQWTTDDILRVGGVSAQLFAYNKTSSDPTTTYNLGWVKMKLCWGS